MCISRLTAMSCCLLQLWHFCCELFLFFFLVNIFCLLFCFHYLLFCYRYYSVKLIFSLCLAFRHFSLLAIFVVINLSINHTVWDMAFEQQFSSVGELCATILLAIQSWTTNMLKGLSVCFIQSRSVEKVWLSRIKCLSFYLLHAMFLVTWLNRKFND